MIMKICYDKTHSSDLLSIHKWHVAELPSDFKAVLIINHQSLLTDMNTRDVKGLQAVNIKRAFLSARRSYLTQL